MEISQEIQYKIVSTKPIDVISESVPSGCERHSFALLQTYVYHDIVESKGFPIQRKVYIFEICQAKVAALLLTEYPHFSIFMPCRIVLYEDQGQTVVCTMDMDPMLDAIKSNEAIFSEAKQLFDRLKTLLTELAQ